MDLKISHLAQINDRVRLGKGSSIGDFVLLGAEPNSDGGDLELKIGQKANIRSHSVIYLGATIGDSFQTGHSVLIREFCTIGDGVSIGSHSIIEHHVHIANNVRIHSGAFIPEFSILEENCWIGPHVVFTNAIYPRSINVKNELRGPHILPNAKIGANATLLPGIVIGENSLVGAGSVVIRDVPAGKVVAGNPAGIIRDVQDIPAYQISKMLGNGD